MSRFWHLAFRILYRILALIDPLVRAWWKPFGLGNVVEFEVAHRHGKGTRRRLLGLLQADGRWYLGHPDGHVGWTRDLEATGEGSVRWPDGAAVVVQAQRLANGPEREAAIRATMQHPFPGNLVYRLGRRHVRAVGVFFRLQYPDELQRPGEAPA